jgi:hypothetical protein
VQSITGSSAVDNFQGLFGVSTANPDSWLKEKGKQLGREVMCKLMQAVYVEHGLQPPAAAVGTSAPEKLDIKPQLVGDFAAAILLLLYCLVTQGHKLGQHAHIQAQNAWVSLLSGGNAFWSCTAWLVLSPRPLYGLSLFLGLANIVEAFGIALLCFSGSDGLRVRDVGSYHSFLWNEGLCLPAFVPCYGLDVPPVTHPGTP